MMTKVLWFMGEITVAVPHIVFIDTSLPKIIRVYFVGGGHRDFVFDNQKDVFEAKTNLENKMSQFWENRNA